MRRQVEAAFETVSGGETPLITWLLREKARGASLRTLAALLSAQTGLTVSHETVRKWMLEG
jgi:transposase-like protein